MAFIEAEHVWKRFMLHRDRAESVGQILRQMLPGRPKLKAEPFWALRDVSFTMSQGESLGIIGNNGSGKSTLLKLVTRTMKPTSGHIGVHGRLSALIELGAGFHPDFTGRENVVLNASILGVGRREIERRMEDIITFADIRPFIDVPVKYYSSGMHARLGFAVAINVDPEILIVDEVLAVGDEAFQQKCMDRIFEMKRSGVSILLVSHDLGSIERLMERAVWLSSGSVQRDGRPRDVVQAYRSHLGEAAGGQPEVGTDLDGMGPVRLQGVEVRGSQAQRIFAGEPGKITCRWESDIPFQGAVTITIRRPDGLVVADLSSREDDVLVELPAGASEVTVAVSQMVLTTGRYEVEVSLFNAGGERIHHWPQATEFTVQALKRTQGVIALPHTWQTWDV